MKAAVLYGQEKIRVEKVSTAALQPGEVRIHIEAALTCGTDLKVFKRGYHARMIVPPAVFGHEFSGVISEVHPETPRWKIGDRVVVANSAPCGQCFHCRNQQENLCDDLLFLNGAYAQSIVVPARLVQKNLLKLKPKTSFTDAALDRTAGLRRPGRAGRATALRPECPRHRRGSHRPDVHRAGPRPRLPRHFSGQGSGPAEAAKKLGANHLIDIARKHDLVAAIQAEAAAPFDVVIEAVGKPETWEASVRLVRKGGTVNFFGGCPSGTSVTLDTSLIHYSNLNLLASFHHTPATIRRALELIEAGVIRASEFVDGECSLTRLPELFQSMSAGNRAVKTLIRVHE